ncbi:MAG: HdeD family acid-resistance protein [Caldilineaceae bacterium]|nr:HdeD family acid-resistance protein [Caldilineaceae bacterium]
MNDLTMAADTMRVAVRKTWWILLIQGIAAVLIGLMLLRKPGSTLLAVAIFLGAYWLVGGIFDIIGAFTRRNDDRHWLWSLVGGSLGVLAGILLMSQPLMGAVALPVIMAVFIGVGAIVSGIFNIIWAIRVRDEIEGEGWIIVWGVVSAVLGLWVLTSPFISAAALVWVAGIVAIVGGLVMIVTSIRLRSVTK